jgi:hypothetical protein
MKHDRLPVCDRGKAYWVLTNMLKESTFEELVGPYVYFLTNRQVFAESMEWEWQDSRFLFNSRVAPCGVEAHRAQPLAGAEAP